jgi:hypothetical protein
VPPERERWSSAGISEAERFAFVIVTPERLPTLLAAAIVLGAPSPKGTYAEAL